MLPQPKEATKKAPKKVGQVKKKCLDGRKGANKRHQWEFVFQDPCSIDLSVLQSHQAPSPILVIDFSCLLFHQSPSPLLAIALPGRVRPGGPNPPRVGLSNEKQNQTHLSLGLEVARQCKHAGKSDWMQATTKSRVSRQVSSEIH